MDLKQTILNIFKWIFVKLWKFEQYKILKGAGIKLQGSHTHIFTCSGALMTPVLQPNCREPITAVARENRRQHVTSFYRREKGRSQNKVTVVVKVVHCYRDVKQITKNLNSSTQKDKNQPNHRAWHFHKYCDRAESFC